MTQLGKTAAIIVAAGRGERAGNPQDGPKQYRPIGGKPVIAWTLRTFFQHPEIDAIVVVIHPDDRQLYAGAVDGLKADKPVLVVDGGDTRQHSVLKGLDALSDDAPDHEHHLLDRMAVRRELLQPPVFLVEPHSPDHSQSPTCELIWICASAHPLPGGPKRHHFK